MLSKGMNQLSAMEFVTTTRGAHSLLHEGYKYTLNRRGIHTGDAMIEAAMIEAAPVAVYYFCHVVIVLVCHVVTKIVLDKMGHLLTLLDEMGLDEMG